MTYLIAEIIACLVLAVLIGLLLGWLLGGLASARREREWRSQVEQLNEEVRQLRSARPRSSAAASRKRPRATGQPKKDDLRKIEGIGPKIAGLLNDAGIHSYAQLARAGKRKLRGVLDAAGPRFRMHDPETWTEQARLAAAGKWDALKSLQQKLKGGRRT